MIDSPTASRFIQARNYRPTTGREPSLVVLHSMEAPDTAKTALNVAIWFAGPAAPMASAHYCVDTDEVIQCVRERDVAYAAPGANREGVHVELAGYARNSEGDWLADAPMLNRAAELVADIASRHGIPVEFVDAAGLLAGARGVTTHAEVSKAFHKTDHSDPGASFPLEHFLDLVRDCVDGVGAPDIASVETTV